MSQHVNPSGQCLVIDKYEQLTTVLVFHHIKNTCILCVHLFLQYKMAERWNSETTIKFIEEFRSYECLWNTKSSTYKNKQMRQTSLQKIVEAMNIQGFGIPEAKNKMRNLRSTYYQEKRKIEKSKTSGSGSDEVYVPSLKWYTEMNALLKDVDDSRKTFDNVSMKYFLFYTRFFIVYYITLFKNISCF